MTFNKPILFFILFCFLPMTHFAQAHGGEKPGRLHNPPPLTNLQIDNLQTFIEVQADSLVTINEEMKIFLANENKEFDKSLIRKLPLKHRSAKEYLISYNDFKAEIDSNTFIVSTKIEEDTLFLEIDLSDELLEKGIFNLKLSYQVKGIISKGHKILEWRNVGHFGWNISAAKVTTTATFPEGIKIVRLQTGTAKADKRWTNEKYLADNKAVCDTFLIPTGQWFSATFHYEGDL